MAPEPLEEDIDAIELQIGRRLTHVTPREQLNDDSGTRSNSSIGKRKRPKMRTKAAVRASEEDIESIKKNLEISAKLAEEKAVSLALVRKHPLPTRKESTKTLSGVPKVVKARDLPGSQILKRRRAPVATSAPERVGAAGVSQYVEKHRREVGRFGSAALHKRDRKMYETAQLTKLGCRKPKNEKMPIGVLIKKRKYQKIREQKKKEMDLATGMLVRTRRR